MPLKCVHTYSSVRNADQTASLLFLDNGPVQEPWDLEFKSNPEAHKKPVNQYYAPKIEMTGSE